MGWGSCLTINNRTHTINNKTHTILLFHLIPILQSMTLGRSKVASRSVMCKKDSPSFSTTPRNWGTKGWSASPLSRSKHCFSFSENFFRMLPSPAALKFPLEQSEAVSLSYTLATQLLLSVTQRYLVILFVSQLYSAALLSSVTQQCYSAALLSVTKQCYSALLSSVTQCCSAALL